MALGGQLGAPHTSVRSSVPFSKDGEASAFDRYQKGATSDFQKTTSPRFTQINKTVGEFISLQSRLQEAPLQGQVLDYVGPEEHTLHMAQQLQHQI